MNKPTIYKARVNNKVFLNENIVLVDIGELEPKLIPFEPGQFITLKISQGVYRAYSICSDYKVQDKFQIAVLSGHNGMGSNYVKSLNPGDPLEFIGPSGRFILSDPLPQNLFYFATSTGVSPFISHFYKLVDIHYPGMVRVFFGVKKTVDLFFTKELEYFKNNLPDFSYTICLSDDTNPLYYYGKVNDQLKQNFLGNASYYLCGNPNMVSETRQKLFELGIIEANIFTEMFSKVTS